MASTPSIGYNPLPWLLGPDGFTLDVPTLRTAFAAIAGAGFTAVQADVPEGTSPAEYCWTATGCAPPPATSRRPSRTVPPCPASWNGPAVTPGPRPRSA
ncbi:hypothetical protein OG824_34835 [Streptomyces prunicolor]|uniref:hypothetical protein n=1 Tax=Streptomyces prunicolor TaxID=67348 RepID=UPI00225546FB|nr:hypothetical protein [Streptomyces prunicolor]MCX5240399.1 hypothetical protein [Streptomyces prunicolor]